MTTHNEWELRTGGLGWDGRERNLPMTILERKQESYLVRGMFKPKYVYVVIVGGLD